MISEKQIERVKSTADITYIIEKLVPLRRAGSRYVGLCPFHNEKTPSFSVSPTRQMYKCFGCGRTGDVFSFLQEHQGLAFPEAFKYVADQYGIEVEQWNDPNEYLYEIMEQWSSEFREQLKSNAMAIDYLLGRGITRPEIQTFEIGYCPYRRPEDAMLIGYDKYTDMRKAGMISERGFLLFSGRITFPVRNAAGNMIGFSGRALSATPGSHKYVNSMQSDVYQKDRVLYGLKMARSMATLRGEMNVTEGYTDVIAMHRAGMSNTVACCGTAFTTEHARLIKKYCPRVVFYFDGDAAGEKAAQRSVEIALQEELQVSIRHMPAGEDVFSYVQAEKKVSDIPLRTISSLFITSQGKDSFRKKEDIDAIVNILAKIQDPIVRDLEVKEICRTLGADYRLIHKSLISLLNKSDKQYAHLRRPSSLGQGRRIKSRDF